MKLRTRLQRLEQTAANRLRAHEGYRSPVARVEEYLSYLCGDGPRPPHLPCPPGTDPTRWPSWKRQAQCLDSWILSGCTRMEFTADLTEEERRAALGLARAFWSAAVREECGQPPPTDDFNPEIIEKVT
jgi:hypothetical protein